MLTHTFRLATLAALAVALPVLVYSFDPLLTLKVAVWPVAALLLFGFAQQWNLNLKINEGMKSRAVFVPFRPSSVIDQPSLPAPIPAEPAVIKSESVRLIPVHHAGRTYATSAEPVAFQSRQMIDGVDVLDLTYFIELLPAKGGHQRRRWLGTTLPSGRKVDADYYELLIAPLVKCKAIVGRAPRVAGTLTCSPQTIKERLQLAP